MVGRLQARVRAPSSYRWRPTPHGALCVAPWDDDHVKNHVVDVWSGHEDTTHRHPQGRLSGLLVETTITTRVAMSCAQYRNGVLRGTEAVEFRAHDARS